MMRFGSRERTREVAVLAAITALVAAPQLARASVDRDGMRAMILSGSKLPEAIAGMSGSVRASLDASLVAEYSLALASSGLVSAALYQMDRAFMMAPTDDEVLYAGSTLLAWLGMTQAADELKRPAPEWVRGPLPLLSKSHKRSDISAGLGPLDQALRQSSDLMERSRFITALDRLSRITAMHPKEPLAWAGYAIALEKVGAYKTAAKAVAMELTLSPQLDDSDRSLLTDHIQELDQRAPVAKKPLIESLKGRYTAFAGGSLSGTSGSPTVYAFSAQAGKFLTEHLNVSLDLGYSTVTRLAVGLGERYYLPIPGTPISPTLGSRVEYDSLPSSVDTGNVGLIVSPGLSVFSGRGSLDIFVDLGISGSQTGNKSISLGYTVYLGEGQW